MNRRSRGRAPLRALVLVGVLAGVGGVSCGSGARDGPRAGRSQRDMRDGRSVLIDAALDLHAPALVALPDGTAALVALASDGDEDRVFASFLRREEWSEPIWLSESGAACLAPRATALAPDGLLVVWAEQRDGGWDLLAREFRGAALGPLERITHDPDPDCQPALASSAEGIPHAAWSARRAGRWEVLLSRRAPGGWSAPEVLTDGPGSSFEPALGRSADGSLWAAWTACDAPGELPGTHLCRLAPRAGALQRLPSERFDGTPELIETRAGLALLRTRHSLPVVHRGGLSAAEYDRWADKVFVLAEIGPDGAGPESELRLAPNRRGTPTVSVDAAPVALGDGTLWLAYGETEKDGGRFEVRVARLGAGGAVERAELEPGRFHPGSPPCATALEGGEALITAHTVYDDKGASPDVPSWIELVAVPTAGLELSSVRLEPNTQEQANELPALPPLRSTWTLGPATWQVYYGNLHLHSDLSRDAAGTEGSPFDNYYVVRDLIGLDFAALTDHAELLRRSEWRDSSKTTDLWNEPGRFVTLPGYEWTSFRYGHKNVLFPDTTDAVLIQALEATPDDLWSELGERRALAIPHHPSQALKEPTDWSFHDDRFERLVEIFQVRGSYEADGALLSASDAHGETYVPGHSVRDALGLGHRLGFIASPDHGGGFGVAGVWADGLTREALFAALEARRTFATTGPRMPLAFSANSVAMGGTLRLAPGEPLELEGRVACHVPPVEVVLVAGGEERRQWRLEAAEGSIRWTEEARPAAAYYYLRVRQGDGHLAWSSPIWVSE